MVSIEGMIAMARMIQRGLVLTGVAIMLAALLLAGNADAQKNSVKQGDPDVSQQLLYSRLVSVPPQFVGSYQGPYSFNLPAGFTTPAVFASGLSSPRMIAVGACGDLYAGSSGGTVYRLPDRNHDGVADGVYTLTTGLPNPAHSVEYWNGRYYVGAGDGVYRFDQANCDVAGSNQTKIVDLPRDLPSGGGHVTRTVVHGLDGKLYVSVGSSCNVCVEVDSRRAAILRFAADGPSSSQEIFSSGMRNDVGLAFRPGTNDLWTTENGRDYLGNGEGPEAFNYYPPEEVNFAQAGRYYGWPYCFADGKEDRSANGTNSVAPPAYNGNGKSLAQYCAASSKPIAQMQAHSAPMAILFSKDSSLGFPASWKKGIFVAQHGSWNRSNNGSYPPVGYKIVYIPAFAGHTGNNWNPPSLDFLTSNPQQAVRPVGLLIGTDNALYFSADNSGTIYRIAYSGLSDGQ